VRPVDHLKYFSKIGEAFSPSAPIDRQALFAGRVAQLRDAITAISQRGQHAIIYGERGVGKTSLANVLFSLYGNQVNKPECGIVNCDGTMGFSDIWHTVFREMHTQDGTLNDLAKEEITPDDVRHILQHVSKTLVILDEVDRLTDRQATTQLADTVKNLSDHSIPTTLVLVGVADSVDALISEHVSIERNIIQIAMPRMSITELKEVISKGADIIGMTIDDVSRNRVALLSQGLPHYTHLLSLYAFQAAVERDSLSVEEQDVRIAIERALSKAQPSVISAYQNAVTSPRKDNLYAQVLLACAIAETDALGYFYAGDVRSPMSTIMKKNYELPSFSQHLNAFCDAERGPILKRTGIKRKYRFRFVNPLMRPYVLMSGIQSGLIEESQIPQ
jgi:Cdc6-like AAA superfamily ATPase